MCLDSQHKESAIRLLDIIYDSESSDEEVRVAKCSLLGMVAPEILPIERAFESLEDCDTP